MGYQAVISETGAAFEILEGETILEAARRSGIHISHQCEIGVCATCRIKLGQGSVSYSDPIDGLTEEEIDSGYVLACRAQACSNIAFHAERRLPPCSKPSQINAVIIEIAPITPNVYKLVLKPEELQELVIRPGQYANLFLNDDVYRSFSIAHQSKSGNLEFLIKKIPDGIFTDKFLGQSEIGNKIKIEAPLGAFSFHEDDYMPLIFVATGTGIAPIKSIVDALVKIDDCPPMKIYWGVRSEEDLFLDQEISIWADHFEDFEFIPVLSKPSSNWSGRVGHVQDVVLSDFSDLSDFAIYLCGSPGMIGDATQVFCNANANLSHVYIDAFHFQKENLTV